MSILISRLSACSDLFSTVDRATRDRYVEHGFLSYIGLTGKDNREICVDPFAVSLSFTMMLVLSRSDGWEAKTYHTLPPAREGVPRFGGSE